MTNKALRYNKKSISGFGRKPRQCLPCKERDLFIVECAANGVSTIGLRQKNRYIDELLVFVDKQYGFTSVDQLTPEHVDAYIKAVQSKPFIKDSTKRVKLVQASQWLRWLYASKLVKRALV